MSEPLAIPHAPRNPTWRAALRTRWVLGVISAALLFADAVLITIMLAVGADVLPFADDALDAERSIAPGEVIAIGSSGLHSGDRHYARYDFKFEAQDGGTYYGHSFMQLRAGLYTGSSVRVEYLAHAPDVCRISGSRRNPLGTLWTVLFGVLVLPSLALFLLYWRGVFRTRLLLGTGAVAEARITGQKPLGFVNPPQIRVTYEFADAQGQERLGSHWVGKRSLLGRRLEAGDDTVAVCYDEAEPDKNRLCLPEDFLN